MRGKAFLRQCRNRCIGITPAHAGKRHTLVPCWVVLRDHPRTCGEKRVRCIVRRPSAGSPPHMRGKEMFVKGKWKPNRITPAHAGKSASHGCGSRGWRDHPRTWGKVQLHPGQPAALGITPAHAGKSLFAVRRGFSNWDHPRTCGEKASGQFIGFTVVGSPPHMRGKAFKLNICLFHFGITPAHAGKRCIPE